MSGVTPLPTPPSINDPENFDTRADAFMAALPQFVTEINTIIGQTIPAGSAAAGTLTGGTLAANVLASSLTSLGTINVLTVGSGIIDNGYLDLNGPFFLNDTYIPTAASLGQLISGLTYQNNVADATNDVDIAVGMAMSSDGAMLMTIASALTKRLDANWVAGNNQGALLSGSIANTRYNVWLIGNTTTAACDIGFETTANATPTLPSGYTKYRKVGWFLRSGGLIVQFKTYEVEGGGLEFTWLAPTLDIDLSNTLTTSNRSDAISVPLTFTVVANLNVTLVDASAAGKALIYNPDNQLGAPSLTAAPLSTVGWSAAATAAYAPQNILVRTSSTGQIGAIADLATVDVYRVSTLGFTWSRR